MILDSLLGQGRVEPRWVRVIIGAGVAALVVSGCTAGAMWLFGMGANAGIASALGAAAGAVYGVNVHRSPRR
jgi:hypothetical protein